jgi:hypothetical protein
MALHSGSDVSQPYHAGAMVRGPKYETKLVYFAIQCRFNSQFGTRFTPWQINWIVSTAKS